MHIIMSFELWCMLYVISHKITGHGERETRITLHFDTMYKWNVQVRKSFKLKSSPLDFSIHFFFFGKHLLFQVSLRLKNSGFKPNATLNIFYSIESQLLEMSRHVLYKFKW